MILFIIIIYHLASHCTSCKRDIMGHRDEQAKCYAFHCINYDRTTTVSNYDNRNDLTSRHNGKNW